MTANSPANSSTAIVFAGIPAVNCALYHQVRFLVGDPAALVILDSGRRIFLVRDIELERARRSARAEEMFAPAEFTPADGLSGDRETATAQALAECLVRNRVTSIRGDRTLSLIYVEHIRARGIHVHYDRDLGVQARRQKDAQELGWLRHAQGVTEQVMRRACETIARAEPRQGGVLWHDGSQLTAERLRALVDVWLLERGFQNPASIIAAGPLGGDCHELGHGELRTGEPVIVDIFPQDKATRYYGDCTRTVVHGEIPSEVVRMHATVVAAKRAAIAACRAGVTGEAVHAATRGEVERAGYAMGLPPANAPASFCSMAHGTGHGIGLEIHEPPLLDRGGPALMEGDVITVEPGLYCPALGGVRVEDMVAVTASGCDNFNSLPEGLVWR